MPRLFRQVQVVEKGDLLTVLCLDTGRRAYVRRLPDGLFRYEGEHA